MFILTLVVSCLLIRPDQAFEADKVTSLPGLSKPLDFGLYSGYLDATQGTHLHYIFVESQNDPENDPVVLWLNGGPGCSSLLGFFTEQGPFRFEDSTMVNNPYSWNKVANMIFLESPAGVGYSYSDSGNYTHDDDTTSLNNLLAIKSWYTKFPQYKKNDFYISGESYAGVYLPTLSIRLLDEPEINYVGFAIGNGYLDQKLLGNSMIRFAYYHGIIDSSIWNLLVATCCENGNESPESCDFATNSRLDCSFAVRSAENFIDSINLNPYAIYDDCKIADPTRLSSMKSRSNSNSTNVQSNREKVGWRLINKTFNAFVQRGTRPRSEAQTAPCLDDSALIEYLSSSEVRKSLNIPTNLPNWIDCSEEVSRNYQMQYPTLKDQVIASIKAGKRGLIYNGDVDLVCDFLGDEWFSDQLGFRKISSYKPWYVNNQVAGFVKNYQGFSFATIRGSGHAVPEYRPAAALYMIENFLSNNKLA